MHIFETLYDKIFQALLFSCKHGAAIRRVIAVYKDWFQVIRRGPHIKGYTDIYLGPVVQN